MANKRLWGSSSFFFKIEEKNYKLWWNQNNCTFRSWRKSL